MQTNKNHLCEILSSYHKNQEMMEVLQEYENKLYRSTNETEEYKQKDFAYTLFIKILQEQFFNFSWKT
jgi:hypothetical protein